MRAAFDDDRPPQGHEQELSFLLRASRTGALAGLLFALVCCYCCCRAQTAARHDSPRIM